MKRLMALILTALLVPALNVMARGHGGDSQDGYDNKDSTQSQDTKATQKNSNDNPVLINVARPSSGGHNRNYPAQQQQQTAKQQAAGNTPSYGNLQWTTKSQAKQRNQNRARTQQYTAPAQTNNRPNDMKNNVTINKHTVVNNYSVQGVSAAGVVHHHPYEQNYVRKKLQNLGVKSAPGYITRREEVIHTDREHSRIEFPKTGFGGRAINADPISPRHFNDRAVKTQMSMVVSIGWQNKILGFDRAETMSNHYYWHNDRNFNYCHYIDHMGYHWYGWYAGNKYFWTRHFNNRWWWYDGDFDRWCFWNNGFWWWQDPYHIGDLYCYNNTTYIPVNSAEDNVAVAVPDDNNTQSYTSPDNTRVVKVVADTQDAFLYDTANPPEFNPVYLASGVTDVMFSDTDNGRPLEIILKLNNKSFDMFDGNGNAYNPANSGVEQPAPGEAVQ
jgi:hypothetical protein